MATLATAGPNAPVIRARADGLLDVVAPASGAVLRYTLDGTEPDCGAGVWLAPPGAVSSSCST